MLTDRASLRVDEAEAALELLLERGMTARGTELQRIYAGVAAILASDPDWIDQHFQGGALHVVPRPKLLELLAPMATVREALNASRSRPAACYTGGSRGGRIRMLVRLSILVLLLCMSQTLAQVPPDTSPLAPIAPAPPPSAPVVRQVPPPPTLAPVPSDDYRDPANRGKIHRGLRM